MRRRKIGILFLLPSVAVIIAAGFGTGSCIRQGSIDPDAGEETACNDLSGGDASGGESAGGAALEPIEGFLVYDNPAYHFRVQYPAEWTKDEGTNRVSFIMPPREPEQELAECFNILFDTMTGERMSLSQYASIIIGGLEKQTPDFSLIESNDTTLGGHPAFRITYTGRADEIEVQYAAFFLIRCGLLYVVNCATLPGRLEEYGETLHLILSSFQFLS
ncbi:MAG: hypothetical protein JW881_02625 [Spirochaetales bacterium]|nr:hypothetical protein [Spirochaetales bacterium]